MVGSINEAPKWFKGLGYEKVCTILLDREVKHVDGALKLIWDSWIETSVSIVSNGWKDARNRPLIDFIVVSTRGAMFSRTIDYEGQAIETHFASNTIVLRCFVKVHEALSTIVITANWSIWRQSSSTRAAAIKAMILDDSWWDHAEYLLRFIEPILNMIRYTNIDKPSLGEVYDGIDSMIEDVKKNINEKEQDPEVTFFKKLQKFMEGRWNKMIAPLH